MSSCRFSAKGLRCKPRRFAKTDRGLEPLRRALAVERLEPRTLLSVGPFGPEFRVNTDTSDDQEYSAVAMDADGDFVVVWERHHGYGYAHDEGVYAQRYDAAGAQQGGEFLVNTSASDYQGAAAVAMDADGDFVVTWESSGQDGSGWGVYAQRYNAAGMAQGGEFRVNTYTTDDQKSPAVAMDAAGNFVVTWESSGEDGSDAGVYAQRYNAAGSPLGNEFRVNTYTMSYQWEPAVAMDADGDFVVAWQSRSQDGSGWGIYAQRYNAAGVAQGGEVRVNTYTTGHQAGAAVAMDADGDFVVAWQSDAQDGSGYGVYAQRYSAAGMAQGGEFRVNSHTNRYQWVPAMAMDAAGNFVVAWQSFDQDGSGYGVYGQQYDAAGVPRGGEFRANTYTDRDQKFPAVAMDADGDFVVAWQSIGQYDDHFDVYAQRYVATAAFEGRVWDDLDADGVQDAGEPGLDGVEVRLLRSGETIATTTSSSGGVYAFDGLQARLPWIVEVARPWGRKFSPLDAAADDSRDSDVDPLTGRTAEFTLPPGDERQPGPDAGLFASENVIGTVYLDANGNGSRDAGEVGLEAWIVYWDANENGALDPGEPSVASDRAGAYRIEDLQPGACRIAVVDQLHWLPTAARMVTLGSGQTLEGVAFGARKTVADSDARPAGDEFRVNTHTASTQSDPVVAMDADGDFVVAWSSRYQDGSKYGVFAQRYNASGVPQGSEFRVNTCTTLDQAYPAGASSTGGLRRRHGSRPRP